MQYLFMAIFAACIVAADQWSKLWTVEHIRPVWEKHLVQTMQDFSFSPEELAAMPAERPGIRGVFHLVHTHNEGAAWSAMEGMIWLFAFIFLVFTVVLVMELIRNKMGFTAFEKWCLMAVWGGGLGNMIDRLRLGYVVDMIEVDFISFPVFNVADCFITCGCILLIFHLIFFNKEFWKDEKK